MSDPCGWVCIGGVVVGLGFLGLFLLLFSPRVEIPFWLFALLSICLAASLGVFLGVAVDVLLRNRAPIAAIVGGIVGVLLGAYYALNVYRASLPRQ